MKHLRKISSIVLTLIMVLAMGTSVFAAGTGVNAGDTISLEKEILVYNDDSSVSKIYGPEIEYKYTVSAAEPEGKTVTDKDGDKMAVKKGLDGGLTVEGTGIAKFEKNREVNMTNGVGSLTANVTLKANIAAFTTAASNGAENIGAGIYRYRIAESVSDDAFKAAGLTRPDGYLAERYADVYIKNGTNGLEVAGIVVFIGNKSIDGKTAGNNEITGKTTGFVDTYDNDITDEAETDGSGMADKYYTYNYSLTKSVTGTMADKTHPFPFNIATAGVEGQNYTVEGSDTLGAIGTAVTKNLSDGQTLEIKGLPANTTINVTETNDTPDTYKVTVTDGEKTFINGVNVPAGKEKSMSEDALALTNYADNTKVKPTANLTGTTFENNLNEVSPTNVVMRFAPYLFILGGAMLLLFASRRRKSDQE